MSKFKVGDHVRVTAPDRFASDQAGNVARVDVSHDFPYVVEFARHVKSRYKEHELTLADPEPHAVPPALNRRAEVLRTAESLVNGARADDYGPPQENFGRVAAMWSAQFAAKLKEPLTADEVAIALVHLKLSRLANTPDHADSFIDAAGYIALAAEIAEAAL